jgi:hypothetical protein
MILTLAIVVALALLYCLLWSAGDKPDGDE